MQRFAFSVFAAAAPIVALPDRPGDVPPGLNHVLGLGYDLAKQNFWDWSNLYGAQVFSDSMPTVCFREQPCQHGLVVEHEHFDAIEQWEQYFESGFGLHLSGGYDNMQASISASVGSTFDNTFVSERESVFMKVANRRACYELSSDCLAKPNNLHPEVLAKTMELPLGKTDETSMKAWQRDFVGLFGTHVVIGSEHGAKIQSLASIDSSCHFTSDCLQANACLDFSFSSYLEAHICANQTRCSTRKGCTSLYHDNCVVSGGDGNASVTLCSNNTKLDQLQSFLDSGDVKTGASAIGYTFKPIADLLSYMGLKNASDAVAKAVEYNSCQVPSHSWQQADTGDYSCQCTLKCKNGGTLNKESCSCECQGDEYHGWTGGDCSKTYGTCQKGAGSANEAAALRCEMDNLCASDFWKQDCGPTGMCCLTDFKGACCPFGSTCDCGGSSCTCLDPTKILQFV